MQRYTESYRSLVPTDHDTPKKNKSNRTGVTNGGFFFRVTPVHKAENH